MAQVSSSLPVLTVSNCCFIALHSNPMGCFVRGDKVSEWRAYVCNYEYVFLASVKKDDETLFETDVSIKPNTMYVIGRVVQPQVDCSNDPNAYARFRWDFTPM